MLEVSRRGWATIAAVGLALATAGCRSASDRPREHASAALLDSGPSPRLSKGQKADVQVALGRSLEEQGQSEGARAAYLDALAKDPKRADAEVRLAILDDRQGDAAGADRHFARALKLRPDDPEILCDRGYCLYLRRDWAGAEAKLRAALAIDPTHARGHTNLGLVLARKGEPDAALAQFALAGCDRSDARANLALVLATEGRVEDARREYARALADKPGSPAAKDGLLASTRAIAGREAGGSVAAKVAPVDPAVGRVSAPESR